MTMLKIKTIQPKDRIVFGKLYKGEDHTNNLNADIIPGVSIRIYGVYGNHVNGPKPFDRTFRLGDEVEYDSYNLSYIGKIVKIGPKTISVESPWDSTRSKIVRMNLYGFCWRNWDLDLKKISKDNFNMMVTL